MNLQVCVPYQKCPFNCPMCIAKGRNTYPNLYELNYDDYMQELTDTIKELIPKVGNNITTTSGDLNIDSFNNQINFVDDVNITGNLDITGDITIGGNVTIGDETTDSINITAGISSDIIPALDNTYNVGSSTKRWNTIFANEAQIDSVNIKGNLIQIGRYKKGKQKFLIRINTHGFNPKLGITKSILLFLILD